MKLSFVFVLVAIIASTTFAHNGVDHSANEGSEAHENVGSTVDDAIDKIGSLADDIAEVASMSGSMDMDKTVGSDESKSGVKKDDSAATGSIIATSAAAFTVAIAALL